MRTSWLLAVLPLAALAACNTVTTGGNGVLTFTPDECGESGCSLDDKLAVGTSALVRLESNSDDRGKLRGDISDLTLISANPNVFEVQLVRRDSQESDWRVTAVGNGNADLVAIDPGGYEIDFTPVQVRFADRLDLVLVSGKAVGPNVRLGYDQVWTVNANQDVLFRAELSARGESLTGKVPFHVDIDRVLFDNLDFLNDTDAGELGFEVPAGEYPVTYQSPDGHILRALIIAQ
jgi:hypothetical protein